MIKGLDAVFEDVARYIVINRNTSKYLIQQEFKIGFNRVGRIMMQLERAHIIGPPHGIDSQDILFADISSLEAKFQDLEQRAQEYGDPFALTRDETLEKERKDRLGEEELERMTFEVEKQKIAKRLKEKYRKQALEKIVRQELIDSGELFGEQPKRPPIPREVVDAVYKRDGGRCVYCGSTENLQLDHIIPFSKGGATTVENLQLLCQRCNIEKSNKIG